MERPTASERSRNLREWHRDHPERKLAGVCAGVAEQLGASVVAVRAGFVLLTLFPAFHGVGIWLYGILWFLMPGERDGDSGLDRVLDFGRTLLGESQREVRDVGPDPRDI